MLNTEFIDFVKANCGSQAMCEAITDGYILCFGDNAKLEAELQPLKSLDGADNSMSGGKTVEGNFSNLSSEDVDKLSASLPAISDAQKEVTAAKDEVTKASNPTDILAANEKLAAGLDTLDNASKVAAAQFNDSQAQSSQQV